MKLRPAVAIAVKFCGREGPAACIRLWKGAIAATSGTQGIVIAVPDVDVEPITVNGAGLKAMLDALGGEAVLSIGKGRKLVIAGTGCQYQLQAIPEANAPDIPTPAETGWAPITAAQARALSSLADAVDPNVRGNAALAGLRLTPFWCAAASNATAVIATMAIVSRPATAPSQVFAGLDGDGMIALGRQTIWVRTAEQTRWTLGLNGEWPDQGIEQLLDAARKGANRVVAAIDLQALAALCKLATAAVTARADPFRLVLEADRLRLTGGDSGRSHGSRDFDGAMACTTSPGRSEVGVSAFHLHELLPAIGEREGFISVGAPSDPILAWANSDPKVEVLAMPLHL